MGYPSLPTGCAQPVHRLIRCLSTPCYRLAHSVFHRVIHCAGTVTHSLHRLIRPLPTGLPTAAPPAEPGLPWPAARLPNKTAVPAWRHATTLCPCRKCHDLPLHGKQYRLRRAARAAPRLDRHARGAISTPAESSLQVRCQQLIDCLSTRLCTHRFACFCGRTGTIQRCPQLFQPLFTRLPTKLSPLFHVASSSEVVQPRIAVLHCLHTAYAGAYPQSSPQAGPAQGG